MERKNEKHIGSLLNEFLKSNNLKQSYSEYKIIKNWSLILGKTVDKATKSIYIKDRKLFVKLQSSVLKNELSMMKGDIIKRLNEEAGNEAIVDIIFR